MASEPVVSRPSLASLIREPVELLRAKESTSDSGEVVRTWESLGTARAQVIQSSVPERLASQQLVSGRRAAFRLWRTEITASLRAADAIVWHGDTYELDGPAVIEGTTVSVTGVAKA